MGGRAAGTAHKALQLYVSQLRKLLGRERLQTKAPGYLLRLERDELDLARFERMQSDGRLRRPSRARAHMLPQLHERYLLDTSPGTRRIR